MFLAIETGYSKASPAIAASRPSLVRSTKLALGGVDGFVDGSEEPEVSDSLRSEPSVKSISGGVMEGMMEARMKEDF